MDTKKQIVSVNIVEKKKIYYVLDKNGKPIKYKQWLGNVFSFLYDRIMEKSVFPKKLSGSIQKHFEILKKELQNTHNKNILEIATGSGNAVKFINNDNSYTGTDISQGLLRLAEKNFTSYGFRNAEFYIASAENLPFTDGSFDVSICNLALNFFDDIEYFILELRRVLKTGGVFICSVPVPERKNPKSKINGKLYSEKELFEFFNKHNFAFEALPHENGALLYFRAKLN